MKNKLGKLLAAIALLAIAFTTNVQADPLSLNSPGVVGVWDFRAPANVATEIVAAQTLLNMAANVGTFGTDAFVTTSLDVSGTLTGGLQTDTSVSGYDWGFAKYDGQNAGYVLFWLGGATASTVIPQYPANLWTTKPEQYAISHLTVFNQSSSVPEGGMTAVLLGLGLVAMSFAARRRPAA
jgi:hypothetical protein